MVQSNVARRVVYRTMDKLARNMPLPDLGLYIYEWWNNNADLPSPVAQNPGIYSDVPRECNEES